MVLTVSAASGCRIGRAGRAGRRTWSAVVAGRAWGRRCGTAGGAARRSQWEAAQRAVAVVGERGARADGDRARHDAAGRLSRPAAGRGVRVHAAAAGRLPQAGPQASARRDAARARARLRPHRAQQSRSRAVPADHAAPARAVVEGQHAAGRVVRRGVRVVRSLRADRVGQPLRDLRLRPDAGAASRHVRADQALRPRPHAAGAAARAAGGHGRPDASAPAAGRAGRRSG